MIFKNKEVYCRVGEDIQQDIYKTKNGYTVLVRCGEYQFGGYSVAITPRYYKPRITDSSVIHSDSWIQYREYRTSFKDGTEFALNKVENDC